jgi:hypothetical protein
MKYDPHDIFGFFQTGSANRHRKVVLMTTSYVINISQRKQRRKRDAHLK